MKYLAFLLMFIPAIGNAQLNQIEDRLSQWDGGDSLLRYKIEQNELYVQRQFQKIRKRIDRIERRSGKNIKIYMEILPSTYSCKHGINNLLIIEHTFGIMEYICQICGSHWTDPKLKI